MLRKLTPYLILFVAFTLRVWQLAEVPPGLTHDEAGHGHDAAHILKGVTPIFFTVGYGREPLFDYFNAGLIAGMGASPFTLRFSAVVWGLIALAATHRFTRSLFGWETATLALALMGASFWPLATSRQILRSGMLPAEMAIAALLFVRLNARGTGGAKTTWLLVIGLSLALAAGLYTYIPARALWLVFPLTVFVQVIARTATRRSLASLISIPLAFLLAAPLFIYLSQHPEANLRISALSGPIAALQNGDPSLVLNNAAAFLLALFLPGHGDPFLAYTIPGKPVFDPITALLFLIGLARLLSPAPLTPAPEHRTLSRPLLLCWLVLGLAPSLITGPEALTTRIIGAQPVLYILPALGLVAAGRWSSTAASRWLAARPQPRLRYQRTRGFGILGIGLCSLFIVSLFIATARDYFEAWAQSPYVRAAYQSTLIEMLRAVQGPSVISTVYPSAPHDPYIGELVTSEETRWVDGRLATILRADGPARAPLQLLAPASAPLHPVLAGFYEQKLRVRLRPDDLDPFFLLYQQIPFQPSQAQTVRAVFNGGLQLVAARWLAESYRPGEVAELFLGLTVTDPARLGQPHPPAFQTELNLFTHILAPDGTIFLQQDRLDAPSWQWQEGDTVIQIHQFALPPEAAPGGYSAIVGLYDKITGERLLADDGADHVSVSSLIIQK